MAINKDSFIPLYQQLFEEFKKQIEKGKLKPGESIPSESKLVQKYKLSRGTVRQAMQKLEIEKLIEKFPGRGTYVCEPQTPNIPNTQAQQQASKNADYQSIFDQIIGSTTNTGQIFIKESAKINADAKVKNMMKIQDGDDVFLLERALAFGPEIWCIEKSYFPLEVVNNFDKVDVLAPIYEQYKKITNERIVLSKYIVEVLPLDEKTLNDLKIEKDTPVFNIIRISYLENNMPFDLTFGVYRADRLRMNFGIGFIQDESKFSIKALKEFR
ncbi:MAG: GntR family transcriptional regulator [Candidatus Marinimicrobia bacterium]|nr:GntR family transcriptional regulator [Candidatus Neomarinimicrobiota bacterium]